MADAPRNSNGPMNSAAAAQGQGPARGGVGMSNAEIQATLNAVGKLVPVAGTLADIFGKISGKVSAVTEKAKDWTSELRQTVTFSDSLEDNMKAIMGYQIRMAREGMKVTDVETMKGLFENMRKSAKGMLDEGLFGRKGGAEAKKVMEDLDDKLASFQKRIQGTKIVDPKVLGELNDYLFKTTKVVANLSKGLKGVRLTGLHEDIAKASKALGHITGGKLFNLDKFHVYAAAGSDLKAGKAARQARRMNEFRERRENLASKYIPGWNDPNANFKKSDGTLSDLSKKYRASLLATHGGKLKAGAQAGKEGLGMMASSILTKHMLADASGVKASLGTRMGMGLMARGNGSLTKGVASLATGAIEGGVGGLMELAGPLAPVLAILEGAKAIFDKNQKMNADVHDKLGQGGIYGGGLNAIDSIAQVRSNLNKTGMVNRLGIGYDKNLALAQQMVEGGFGVGNLASGDIAKKNDGTLEGSFGTMQRNAYMYGRAAGLSPTQTMTQTLKLITQYQQSLGDTEDFFVRITRDSTAAGISTMKYIDIIDQVNDQYSRSNKLLMITVQTMKLMSQTGRDTAEDLKEAMDVTTNHGLKRSPEIAGYLAINEMQDPAMRKQMMDLQNLNVQQKAASVAKAMGLTEAEVSAGVDNPKTSAEYLNTLKNKADDLYSKDSPQHQSAEDTLAALETALIPREVMRDAVKLAKTDPNTAGVMLSNSNSNQQLGENRITQTMDTLAAVLDTLKGSGGNVMDFTTTTGKKKLAESLAATGLGAALGANIQEVPKQLADSVASLQMTLKNGYTQDEINAHNRGHDTESGMAKTALYHRVYGSISGMKGFVKAGKDKETGKDVSEAARVMQAMQHDKDATFRELFKDPDNIRMLYGDATVLRAMGEQVTPGDSKALANRATDIVTATRPMADIFADAFTWLFQLLLKPLKDLDDVLTFGHDRPAAITPRQLAEVNKLDTAGALTAVEAKIKKARGASDAVTENRLDAEKEDFQDSLNNISGGHGNEKDYNRVNKFVADNWTAPQGDSSGGVEDFFKSLGTPLDPKTHSVSLNQITEKGIDSQLRAYAAAGKLTMRGDPNVGIMGPGRKILHNIIISTTNNNITGYSNNDVSSSPANVKKDPKLHTHTHKQATHVAQQLAQQLGAD